MGNSSVITGQYRDEKGLSLDIKKGWQVCIMMTTQAYFNHTLMLKGEGDRTIFEYTRGRNSPIEPIYTKVIRSLECDQPTLKIKVPESLRLDCRFSELKIDDDHGDYVAVSYTLLAEDSGDYDYNDLLVHITAYKRVG